MSLNATPEMREYFGVLTSGLDSAMNAASAARAKGLDPQAFVEIIPAEDVAGRVEGIVGPKGIAARIRELEKKKPREMLAFDIVNDIIDRRGDYGLKTDEEAIDQAVRTGVGILTEGVLVAPTEGIAKIKIHNNPDGTDYLSVYFAGPIRSAGGTVAALSVVLADSARQKLGIKDYRPTETEVERYVEEVGMYDSRAAHLQYKPPDDDVRHIVRNCPVCIDGDPTEDFEVSVYKGLARVETDRVRGGVSLVVCEGIAQKASKVMKYTKRVGLNWGWLEPLVKVLKKEGGVEIKPDDRFLDELVAGRPIFSYPSAKGGFRLRYGKTRMTGIAAKAISPASMFLLDCFPAIGTQLKIERPGKGCVVTPCDSIEGPVVKLSDGSVVRVSSSEEAAKVRDSVVKLLFLGDILVSYGDFCKSNHPLLPGGYCEEQWLLELGKASGGKAKVDASKVSADEAIRLCSEYGVPLAPRWTHFWHDVSAEDVKELAEWLAKGALSYDWFKLKEFRVEASPAKSVLEELCVPHSVDGKYVVMEPDVAVSVLSTLGMLSNRSVSLKRFNEVFPEMKGKPVMGLVNALAGFRVKMKAPTYIGARMGRPEKARERLMKPAPHVLFPVGATGGKVRSIAKAFRMAKERDRYEGKGFEAEVARMRCPKCGAVSVSYTCGACGERTVPEFVCPKCGTSAQQETCPKCKAPMQAYDSRAIDFVSLVEAAVAKVKG
ncbi:MAG: DNA polymerase II large subunit, partial [Candidatus ainarchaeum sp.]|nr:DNA polymerase II large subunit [Candidatus ainarchaeum sp.]